MARFGVIIVNFNCPRFLHNQVERLKKYIILDDDTLDIIVADNSKSKQSKAKNSRYCYEHGIIYLPYDFDEGDYSSHHALALNKTVNDYKNNFNALLLIDHDIFLFDYSNIFQRRKEKSFIGLAQVKLDKTYLHPGCMLINLDVEKEDFDFLPCEHMDTGGRMAERIQRSSVEYLNLTYHPYRVDGKDFNYEIIDNHWMHFVKGSNWNQEKRNIHSIRINYLFEQLQGLSK